MDGRIAWLSRNASIIILILCMVEGSWASDCTKYFSSRVDPYGVLSQYELTKRKLILFRHRENGGLFAFERLCQEIIGGEMSVHFGTDFGALNCLLDSIDLVPILPPQKKSQLKSAVQNWGWKSKDGDNAKVKFGRNMKIRFGSTVAAERIYYGLLLLAKTLNEYVFESNQWASPRDFLDLNELYKREGIENLYFELTRHAAH